METRKMMMNTTFTVAVAAACLFADSAVAGTKTSEALASHPLTSFDGTKTKLSAFRGEVVVVNFWASWCAPCREELPIMDKWNTVWSGRGARVVAISIDKEMQKAERFAEKAKLSMTIFHDSPNGLAKTLDLPSLPCTFLLDREGNVVSVLRSSAHKELAKLQQQVESLLAGSSGKPAVQKAGVGAQSEASTDVAKDKSKDGGTQ